MYRTQLCAVGYFFVGLRVMANQFKKLLPCNREMGNGLNGLLSETEKRNYTREYT